MIAIVFAIIALIKYVLPISMGLVKELPDNTVALIKNVLLQIALIPFVLVIHGLDNIVYLISTVDQIYVIPIGMFALDQNKIQDDITNHVVTILIA